MKVKNLWKQIMKFSRIFFPQLIVPRNATVKSPELQSKSQKVISN